MRAITGVALATVMALSGCGTPLADPFREDESETLTSQALESAWKACELWNERHRDTDFDEVDWATPEYHYKEMDGAFQAGSEAAYAAYLDARWRTLADIFPFLERLAEIRAYDARPNTSLSDISRRQLAEAKVYSFAVRMECRAVYVLRGEQESLYDLLIADPGDDPDSE